MRVYSCRPKCAISWHSTATRSPLHLARRLPSSLKGFGAKTNPAELEFKLTKSLIAAVLIASFAGGAFAEAGASVAATQSASTPAQAASAPAEQHAQKRQRAYQPMPDSMRPEADPDKKDRH